MPENKFTQSDPTVIDYLKRIQTGVMVILWIVVTSVLTWPLWAVIDSYTDRNFSNTAEYIIAVVIAGLVAYGVCRMVFPIQYTGPITSTSQQPAKDAENPR